MPRRRVLLMREPIGNCVPEDVAHNLAAIGEVGGIKVDDLADVAYIVLDTEASDYALKGFAPGWRIK